ncbi:MAG: DUF4886 domain-containing protein [Bacteroidales bacterium]|nr:DUF4886 domain-containing protein [Bacteroidales bacterium]
MKKSVLFFVAFCAALGLTPGCTQEKPQPDEGSVIRVSLPEFDSRTAINGVKVSWTAGDAIVVNGAASQPLATAAEVGNFVFDALLSPPYEGVYPASIYKDAQTLSLPRERACDSQVVPLGGRSESTGDLHFSSLTAMLKITVAGTGETTVKNVVLAGLGGEQITGDFSIDYETLALTGASDAEADKSLTVNCNVNLAEPLVLYLPVPAGEYPAGIRVIVTDQNDEIMTREMGPRTLEAGQLRSMPAVTWKVNGIADAADFAEFSAAVNAGTSIARWENAEGWVNLLADIDFAEVENWIPVGNATAPWTSYNPVVTEGHAFTGKFDGNAHHIKNLHLVCDEIVAGRHCGLFGYLGEGAIVQNFVIEDNCSLTVNSSVSLSAGMIAGVLYDADVRDVTSYAPMTYGGSATGYLHMALVGGMYARNRGCTVDSVHNYGEINAPNTANQTNGATAIHIAGIVGFANAPSTGTFRNTISSCNNYGDINSAVARSAGIVGVANSCTDIVLCENRGDQLNTFATSGGSRPGNITCMCANGSTITSCKNYGDLVSTTAGRCGGILSLPNAGTYTDCENYGRIITDSDYRGVFFGYVNTAAVWNGGVASGRVGKYNNGDWQYDLYSEANKISYLGRQGNANGSYNNITYDIQTGEDEPDPDLDVDADFRIFFIGNSFTKDAVEHLPGILHAAGLNGIQLVHMYYGGRTVPEYNSGWATATDYHCYLCNPGQTSWTDISGKSLAQVATGAKFDIVTIQEHTGRQLAWGWTADEKAAVQGLVQKVRDAQTALGASPELYYILSQAYHDLSKAQNVTKPFSNTSGMWTVIAAQGRKVMEECDFDGIISTGAMLQNLRTSGLNNDMGLTRDGYHMDYGLARYGASCTVFETIIGPYNGNVTMTGNSFRYSSTAAGTTAVTDANAPIALKAARYAIAKPYEVTDMAGEGGGDEPEPEADVIKISSAGDLATFAERVNSGDAAAMKAEVTLENDIDCSSIGDWTPIGACTMPTWAHNSAVASGYLFSGSFDGKGHSFKNLHLSFTPDVAAGAWGLFGGLGDGASVKDVIFDETCSMNISTSVSGVFGMLAGLAMGVDIDNVQTYASITGGGTSSLPNNVAGGRIMAGGIVGFVIAGSVPATLSNLYNAGAIGSAEQSFTCGNNKGNGANGVMLGAVVGFASNQNNTQTVTIENCTNDGVIYSSAGRTSGIVSTANRYALLKNCVNNADVHFTGGTGFRIGNITCVAAEGSVLDACINKGDLISSGGASVAGVICLVNHANVTVKNCGSIGASIISDAVKMDADQDYCGVLYGRCRQAAAVFSNCSVNGVVGRYNGGTWDTVPLTADNYFRYVGEPYSSNPTLVPANIGFAQ